MYLKSISLLIFVFLGENEFVVASNTQRPSRQEFDDQIAKFENRFTNTSHLLEVVVTQIQQIQKTLEDIKLTIYFQNETNQKILDSNKEIQKTLEDITLTKCQRLENFTFRNCQEAKGKGINLSSVYKIQPQLSSTPFNVWCDMETRGGGWTYLVNRYDGSQNFDLNWTDYKNGFGNPANEFWLGLEHQHQLTASEDNELLVELVDWDDKKVYAHYSDFRIGNETEGYSIEVIGGYKGNAGDSFSEHRGMKFSTADNDQDTHPDGNCADEEWGGWWYNWCRKAKLTGIYYEGKGDYIKGIYWETFHDTRYSLKAAKMMVRPKHH